jgi:hypothetical protein
MISMLIVCQLIIIRAEYIMRFQTTRQNKRERITYVDGDVLDAVV